jgi:hypothetical protein
VSSVDGFEITNTYVPPVKPIDPKPIRPTDPKVPPTDVAKNPEPPQTGDRIGMWLGGILSALGSIVIIGLIVIRTRRYIPKFSK